MPHAARFGRLGFPSPQGYLYSQETLAIGCTCTAKVCLPMRPRVLATRATLAAKKPWPPGVPLVARQGLPCSRLRVVLLLSFLLLLAKLRAARRALSQGCKQPFANLRGSNSCCPFFLFCANTSKALCKTPHNIEKKLHYRSIIYDKKIAAITQNTQYLHT